MTLLSPQEAARALLTRPQQCCKVGSDWALRQQVGRGHSCLSTCLLACFSFHSWSGEERVEEKWGGGKSAELEHWRVEAAEASWYITG